MIVKYGSFEHPINLTKVDMQITKLRNEGHGKYLVNKKLLISGTLKGETPTEAELSTAIRDLETGYAFENQPAGLYESDGITPTPHFLPVDVTLYGGVRVNTIRWAGPSKAEYAAGGFRTFSIEVEADYLSGTDVISVIEELEIIGTGGPRYGFVELLNARPQRQVINEFTLVHAVQRGSAVWTTGTHAIPAPFWPAYEQQSRRSSGQITLDLNTQRYSRRWSYFFTWVEPLVFPTTPAALNNATFGTGDNWVWGDGSNAVLS